MKTQADRHKEALEHITEEQIQQQLIDWGVPNEDGNVGHGKGYLGASWENWNWDRVGHLESEIRSIESWSGDQWVVCLFGGMNALDGNLVGNPYPGAGKTRIGIMTLRRLAIRFLAVDWMNMNRCEWDAEKGVTCEHPHIRQRGQGLWVSWPSLAALDFDDRDRLAQSMLLRYLVVLDDIGGEHGNELLPLLFNIVNLRGMGSKLTMITSNYSAQGLVTRYGDTRLGDRLRDGAIHLTLNLPSFRGQK